jgi:hypothetical protein
MTFPEGSVNSVNTNKVTYVMTDVPRHLENRKGEKWLSGLDAKIGRPTGLESADAQIAKYLLRSGVRELLFVT